MQETSLFAYREQIEPNLGSRQKCVYETLVKDKNLTNSEIAQRLNWTINTVTPRVYELRKLNLVSEDEKRICRITGRTAIAWRINKNTLF